MSYFSTERAAMKNSNGFLNTIVIPSWRHPNFLAVAIDGLIKHSKFKHKIIIIGSNSDTECSDFLLDAKTFEPYHLYRCVNDYLSKNEVLLMQHDITYIDCTEEIEEFVKKYRAGEIKTINIVKSNEKIQDGTFVAFKNNFALNFVKTKYVINNWDCDFYPSRNWDLGLMAYAEEFESKEGKYMFLPNHIQPYYFETIPDYSNAWEDFRSLACEKIIIPSVRFSRNSACFVTEKYFCDFVDKLSQDGFIKEKPGARQHCHWVPVMYKTDEFKSDIKEYSYQGVCYDLEIDNRSGDLGFVKICPKNSFLLHKGWIPYGNINNKIVINN